MIRIVMIAFSLWMTMGEIPPIFSFQSRFPSPAISEIKPKIYLVASVIWEGDHLLGHNVAAIKKIQSVFPDQTLTHFISPAYFLRGNARAQEARRIFSSIVRSQDEVGLVIHGWKSLAMASGVVFRNENTFWGQPIRPQDCMNDCGKDASLDQYSEKDMDQMFAVASAVLTPQNGILKKPQNLLVAGWLATPTILDAARKNNFLRDYSAISPSIVNDEIGRYPLGQKLSSIWGRQDSILNISSVKTSYGSIVEVGNSAAMADYHDLEQTVSIFKKFIDAAQKKPNQELVFHYGIHQETAFQNFSRFSDVLRACINVARENNVELANLPTVGTQPQSLSQKNLAKSAH